GNFSPRKLHIAHRPEKSRRFGKRARRRRNNRNEGGIFEHGTPDEVRYEILSRRQSHALFERKQHLEPAEFFRFRDGIDSFKMKNRLPPMILAQPAGFQRHPPRLIFAIGMSYKNVLQSCEAFRKISEDFSGD